MVNKEIVSWSKILQVITLELYIAPASFKHTSPAARTPVSQVTFLLSSVQGERGRYA